MWYMTAHTRATVSVLVCITKPCADRAEDSLSSFRTGYSNDTLVENWRGLFCMWGWWGNLPHFFHFNFVKSPCSKHRQHVEISTHIRLVWRQVCKPVICPKQELPDTVHCSGWAFVNEILHDYPKKGIWKKVHALTNRPLKQSDSLWPADNRLNIVSGIDLLKGSQEYLDATIKEQVEGVEEVTHVYYLGTTTSHPRV